MNLKHLCTAPHLRVYFDSWNNWLYVDWEGELTLAAVQQGCLQVARCYLDKAYPRVLNNNTQVTSIAYDVPAWLASDFFPYLRLAGVEQMAWVCSPGLRGRDVAIDTLSRLPQLAVSLFDDVEQAVTWLQHNPPTRPGTHGPLPLPAPAGTSLAKVVQAFTRHVAPAQLPA